MRTAPPLLLALALVAAFASRAGADTKWTEVVSTGTFAFTFNVDGSPVSGTVSYEDGYRWASDGATFEIFGRTDYTFLSDDGTIVGHGVGTFSWRDRVGSTEVNKSTLVVNLFSAEDHRRVGSYRVYNHQTFDANGELRVSIFRLEE